MHEEEEEFPTCVTAGVRVQCVHARLQCLYVHKKCTGGNGKSS